MARYQKYIIVIFLLNALASCGGGGGSNDGATPTGLTGTFIDSTVSGLGYSAQTFSGITDENGQFTYKDGEDVSFFIGNISLGTTPGASIVTPVELVAGAQNSSDPTVSNIIRLLQTLDNDSDHTNGISISTETTLAANGITINLSVDPAILEVDTNLTQFLGAVTNGSALVDASIAQDNFQSVLDGLFSGLAGVWTGTNTLTESNCGDQLGIPQQFTVLIMQNGNDVSVTEGTLYTAVGVISGSHVSLGQYSFDEDGGLTTVTSTDLVISQDGNSLTGGDIWLWTDNDTVNCSGKANISLSKSAGIV